MSAASAIIGLYLPNETTVEEHDIVTAGPALIGDQTTLELGLRAGTVLAGADVEFAGHLEADGDCTLDPRTTVGEHVLVRRHAAVGASCRIDGHLKAGGTVTIHETARVLGSCTGEQSTRTGTPLPAALYAAVFFFYLASGGRLQPPAPLIIPRASTIGDDTWTVQSPAWVGDQCRLHGNLRARAIDLGTETTVFGSLEAAGDINIGRNTTIHGDVTSDTGTVTVADGAHVRGRISAADISVGATAVVEGRMRASGDIIVESLTGPDPPEAE